MELRELHVLSALDPSDPSTVMSLVHRARVYKHFLTKILRCWQPNPVLSRVPPVQPYCLQLYDLNSCSGPTSDVAEPSVRGASGPRASATAVAVRTPLCMLQELSFEGSKPTVPYEQRRDDFKPCSAQCVLD